MIWLKDKHIAAHQAVYIPNFCNFIGIKERLSKKMRIFVEHTVNNVCRHILESAFSLYSVGVNFDNSQSNIGIMWKRRSLWRVYSFFEIYRYKWGCLFLIHITGKSKPYAKDKRCWRPRFSFLCHIEN